MGKEPWKLPALCPIIAPVHHSRAWILRLEHSSVMQSPCCEATVGTRALFLCDCLGNFLRHQILKRGWKQPFPRHLLDLCLLSHLIFTVPTLSRVLWFRGSCPEPPILTTLGCEPKAFLSGPKLCSFPPLSSFPISPDNSLSYLVAGFGDKK